VIRRGTLAVAMCAALACDRRAPETKVDQLRSAPAAVSIPQDPIALASLLLVSPDSLRSAGEERYRSQSYDSARAIWQVELARARAGNDPKAEARVRMWLGIVAWRLSDYASARREGEASLALKRRLGMDNELSRSYNSLGLLAWNEGRHRDALVNYDSAIAAARRHDDLTGIARASSNVPLVKVELGRFDEARVDFNRALEANRKAGDKRTQGNLLANLGMLEIRLGDPGKALQLLSEARAQYSDDEVAGQANALGQLASAYGALGDLQRAIAAADSAIAIARAQGLQQELASNLEVMAELELQAGSSRLALARLKEADSLDAALGLRVERGTNLRRSASILLQLGEVNPAISLARRAMAEHSEVEAGNELVLDRLQLAAALAGDGRKADARSQVDSAASEARVLSNPGTRTEVSVLAARLALDAGDARRALSHLEGTQVSGRPIDWRIADLRAMTLFALGRTTEARKEEEQSIALLERERASLGTGPLRATFLANRSAPFSHFVMMAIAQGDTASAFEVAASLPGRGLTERLGGVQQAASSFASISSGERLLMRAGELERQISEAESDTTAKELASELGRELSRVHAAYESHLAETTPVPRIGMLGLGAVGLRDIQSRLSSGEALLLYLSGPERLYMFVVRNGSLAYHAVPVSGASLSTRVRLVRASLQRSGDIATSRSLLGDLHTLLIGAAERDLGGISSLIVVPHGPLGALPFAALWDRRTGSFLIEKRIVSYLPSVSSMQWRRPARLTATNLTVFVPTPDELPGTVREGRTIGTLVRGSSVLIGRKSSESAVRSALMSGRMVHIAAHGSHNAQNPLFSRMTLGGSGTSRSDRNGSLEVHEIMGLPVKSPLVFLSGCETGLGSEADGPFSAQSDEGSLSQAFLFAGASSVVATLWRVRDSEAAEFAEGFYRNIVAGAAPADALAMTQRNSIRRHTSLGWAAYLISGGGSAKLH